MLENMLLYAIETIKYYVTIGGFVGLKKRNKAWSYIGAMIVEILFSIYISNTNENPLFMFVLFVVVELLLLFDDSKLKIILVGIWLIFFISMIDEIFEMMLELLKFNENKVGLFGSLCTFLFLYTIIYSIRKGNNRLTSEISLKYYVILFVISLAEGITVGVLERFVDEYNDVAKVHIATFLSLIIMIVNVVVVILLSVSNDGYKQRDIVNRENLKIQEKHYSYLKEINEDIRRFKHDYTSHMLNIRNYINKNQYDKLDEYVNRIEVDTHILDTRITVNNGIVDAILNQFLYESNICGVKFEVIGMLSENIFVDAYDMCVIFSNLLKNAVDAAKNSVAKYVSIYVSLKNETFRLKIENSFNGELIKENNKYFTIKNDIVNHGLGIDNVKKSVKKYNGSFEIVDENHIFTAIIEIKNT